MFSVYKIECFDAKSNSHGVGVRSENWVLRLDQSFYCEDEAKDYIRNKNRMCSDLPRFLITLPVEKRSEFVDEFCFGDQYLFYQRYFLGKPNVSKIKHAIQQQGIKIAE